MGRRKKPQVATGEAGLRSQEKEAETGEYDRGEKGLGRHLTARNGLGLDPNKDKVPLYQEDKKNREKPEPPW